MDPTQLVLVGGRILTRSVLPAFVVGCAVWSMLVMAKRSKAADPALARQAEEVESVRQRLARGEIEPQEYNRLLKDVDLPG